MEMSAQIDFTKHPCFNPAVKGSFGRVHLPVAPNCNIRCNYCDRKYDCVNESRPGVTSAVLAPHQALSYLREVLKREPRITVAGIAGPGDPFANSDLTMETLRLIRREFPQLLLCLASNGMGILPFVDELGDLAVSHVTITMNAVDAAIAAKIYAWVRDGKVVYRGVAGAELLLARQDGAVRALKARGITVKINAICVPGVNDLHIPAVAERVRQLGADLFNVMAMHPNAGAPFAAIPEPSPSMVAELREACEVFLPQMRHCTRCRADAVGLLGEDRFGEMQGCLAACATLPEEKKGRPYVAVATMEGMLVNCHLGGAESFQIWEKTEAGFQLVTERRAPSAGGGTRRWLALAALLHDCRAVLVSGIGQTPHKVLVRAGIDPITMNGFIATGLELLYSGQDTSRLKAHKLKCSGGCSGTGGGCL